MAMECVKCETLTLNLPTTTIVAPPSNASKWQMGFNSAFKGLTEFLYKFRFKSVFEMLKSIGLECFTMNYHNLQ